MTKIERSFAAAISGCGQDLLRLKRLLIMFTPSFKFCALTVFLLVATAQTCRAQNGDVVISGNLHLLDTVRVAAEDPGIIRSVVTVGEKLNSGQPIAQLNFELYAAQRDAAEKELAAARLETDNDVDQQFAKVSSDVSRRVLERSLAANRQYRQAVSLTEIERLKLELKRSRWSTIAGQAKQDDIAVRIDSALHAVEKNNPSRTGALPDNRSPRPDKKQATFAAIKHRKTWLILKWSGAGSNRRHMDFQSIALPTELPDLNPQA